MSAPSPSLWLLAQFRVSAEPQNVKHQAFVFKKKQHSFPQQKRTNTNHHQANHKSLKFG